MRQYNFFEFRHDLACRGSKEEEEEEEEEMSGGEIIEYLEEVMEVQLALLTDIMEMSKRMRRKNG